MVSFHMKEDQSSCSPILIIVFFTTGSFTCSKLYMVTTENPWYTLQSESHEAHVDYSRCGLNSSTLRLYNYH